MLLVTYEPLVPSSFESFKQRYAAIGWNYFYIGIQYVVDIYIIHAPLNSIIYALIIFCRLPSNPLHLFFSLLKRTMSLITLAFFHLWTLFKNTMVVHHLCPTWSLMACRITARFSFLKASNSSRDLATLMGKSVSKKTNHQLITHFYITFVVKLKQFNYEISGNLFSFPFWDLN